METATYQIRLLKGFRNYIKPPRPDIHILECVITEDFYIEVPQNEIVEFLEKHKDGGLFNDKWIWDVKEVKR